jgi:hypothetical protein
MYQASIDALGKIIEERYKEIMDHAQGKNQPVPEHKPLYAATFEVPVKKPLPPKKDPRFTYPTLD